MKLLRSLAVYLYVAGKVVYGARYFEKLEKHKNAPTTPCIAVFARQVGTNDTHKTRFFVPLRGQKRPYRCLQCRFCCVFPYAYDCVGLAPPQRYRRG